MWKKILNAAKNNPTSLHLQSNSEIETLEVIDPLTELPGNVEVAKPNPAKVGSTLRFLQDKLGEDRVELNEITGRPCLSHPNNNVQYAVWRGGGIKKVAEAFGLPEWMIGKWIDDHYVPNKFARDLAWPAGYKEHDVQHAPIGYLDPENRFCWPPSYYVTVTEKTFVMALGKVRKQQERQEQQAKVDAASAAAVSTPTPLADSRPRSFAEKLIAWARVIAGSVVAMKPHENRSF